MSRDYDVKQLPLNQAHEYDEAGHIKWVTTYLCDNPVDDNDRWFADHSREENNSVLFWRDDCVFTSENDALDRLIDYLTDAEMAVFMHIRTANA